MAGPLQEKSKRFAVRIVRLSQHLADDKKEFVLSRQVLRSGTSIGANISEARGAQSQSDFIAKLSIAIKEAFETDYWVDLLEETGYIQKPHAQSLKADLNELIAILTKSLKTNKAKRATPQPQLPTLNTQLPTLNS